VFHFIIILKGYTKNNNPVYSNNEKRMKIVYKKTKKLLLF